MKVNKTLLAITTSLVLSTASSSAALLLTFTEDNGNIVVTTSGSVDLTNATFDYDRDIRDWATLGGSHAKFITRAYMTYDMYRGVDLSDASFGSPSMQAAGDSVVNSFWVVDTGFAAYSDGDSAIKRDGVGNVTTPYSSSGSVTFTGVSFASAGFNHVVYNTVTDLWGARADASDSEKVQYLISTVPEPSSATLLGFGGLALLIRRKR